MTLGSVDAGTRLVVPGQSAGASAYKALRSLLGKETMAGRRRHKLRHRDGFAQISRCSNRTGDWAFGLTDLLPRPGVKASTVIDQVSAMTVTRRVRQIALLRTL